MTRNSRLPLALFALAGSALALSACNPSGSAAAPKRSGPVAQASAAANPVSARSARPSRAPARPAATAASAGASHAAAGGSTAGGSAAGRPAASRPAPGPSSSRPSAPATSPALTRVVADCDVASPGLSARPSGIVIACADGNLGVENMTWSNWGTLAASGQGTLYENLCQPNCAEGKYGKYPVAVTLSGVKSSSEGRYFSELSVTWEGTRPPNQTPNSFVLEGPAS
ncbi:MAG: hypothetical protein FWE35_19305 [Streptosporangiales bacterium]|nr:hypothetical protein [Streptosporangiales bacterium]